jgi:uncharacterized protein (DUF2147 family)
MLSVAFAFAAGPDDILGLWTTKGGDARIEIYKCGTNYCGKIAWLKEPVYPAGSKEGVPGMPILDRNNPNPELRKKTLVGSPILIDFVFDGDNLWTDGKIYNSENGKIYSGRLTISSPDRLNVRGFIGIPLLGGSTTWTRAKDGM